jgi:hypothetical protein
MLKSHDQMIRYPDTLSQFIPDHPEKYEDSTIKYVTAILFHIPPNSP